MRRGACARFPGSGKVLARLGTLTMLEGVLVDLLVKHPRFTLTGTTVPLHLLAAQHGVNVSASGSANKGAGRGKRSSAGKGGHAKDPVAVGAAATDPEV